MCKLAACLTVALTACAGEPESIILETPSPSATAPIDPAPTEQPTLTPAPTLTPGPAAPIPAAPAPAAPTTPIHSPKININTADEATLATLPRIGPALAGRIIAYRLQHGPFKTIESLKDVRGIGDATFEAVRDSIVVE